MQKMVCPNCGKKFTYEEVNHIVEHVKKRCRLFAPTVVLKQKQSFRMVIS